MKNILKLILVFIFTLSCWSSLSATEKKVIFGTVNWAPFYGQDLKDKGFMSEITKEAFKRAGWEYEVKFMNWNRAVALAKQGKLDGLQGAYYNEDRSNYFVFTESYADADIVLFAKKTKQQTFTSLMDLKGKHFGIIRGFIYPKKFEDADYLKKELTDSPKANLLKLLKDRIDFIVAEKHVTLDLLNKHFPSKAVQINALAPALEKRPLFNAVSKKIKNSEEIAKEFNKGLEIIKQDGTYNNIFKKHGFMN